MTPEQAVKLLRRSASASFEDARSVAVERRVLAELARAKATSLGRRPLRPMLVVASLAALVAMLLVAQLSFRRSSVKPVGQFVLADGSRAVAVAPDGRVLREVVSPTRVELRQVAGSVEYDVAPRPERLFIVHVGDARVEVLGTAFRIDRSDRAVRVAVTRGRVRLVHGSSRAELSAGEEATLSLSLPAPPPVTSAPAPVASASPNDALAEPLASGASAQPAPTTVPLSAAELFLRADQARNAGDTAGALRHLRELLRIHPADGRASLARFTIGRLESRRGNTRASAEAFESCGDALNGEALAEAALAWAAAGQPQRARALALRYRAHFPQGPRSPALEKLAP